MLGDLVKYIRSLIQNSSIRYSQNTQALADHIRVSGLVVMPRFISSVDFAIALNNEVELGTIEIRNVTAELMLPPKLKSPELTIAKEFPK